MANEKLDLILEIKAQNAQFIKQTKEVQKALQRMEKRQKKASESVFKGVLAARAASAAFRTLSNAVTQGFKNFLEYDDALKEINTLLPESEKLTTKFTKQFLAMSSVYGKSAQEQTKAYYQIVSAGVTNTSQAMYVLNTANKAAVGGVTSVAVAVDGITSILNAYKGVITDAAVASDKMFTTVRLGKTTFEELSVSMGQVLPLARSAGVSIDEVLGMVASLTQVGLSTAEAVTALKGSLTAFVKVGPEAAKHAKSIGLEFGTSAIKSKGFTKALLDTMEATGGNEQELSKLFGRIQGLSAVLALLPKEAREAMLASLEAIKNSQGATERAAAEAAKSAGHQWRVLKESVKNFFIDMFQSFEKDIAKVFKLTKGLLWFLGSVATGMINMVRTFYKSIHYLVMQTMAVLKNIPKGWKAVKEATAAVHKDMAAEFQEIAEHTERIWSGSLWKISEEISKFKEAAGKVVVPDIDLDNKNKKDPLSDEQVKQAQALMEQLRNIGKSREELIRDQYKKDLKLLTEYMEQKKMTTKEKENEIEELQKARDLRLREHKMQTYSSILGDAGSMFGSLSTLAKGESKKSFETAKKLSKAQAVVSGAAAVTGAMQNPPFWPLNAAAVAKAVLMTAAQIKTINAQKFATGVSELPGIGFSDSIPAMLAPKEGVIDARTNKDLISFLKSMKNQTDGFKGQSSPQEVSLNLNLSDEASRLLEMDIIENERTGSSARRIS